MRITKKVCARVLEVVDAGLCSGIGKPELGQMCVEAAVTFALGEDFSDNPSCVSKALRSLKIRLNDSKWSSNEARAKGMRRIAIAQLGTKDKLDEKLFVEKVSKLVIGKTLVKTLRMLANSGKYKNTEELLEVANLCEIEPTKESARKARVAAYAAAAAAYAAAAAADAAADAADAAAAYAAAAYAAAAYAAAAYAADAAADAAAAAYAADADAAAADADAARKQVRDQELSIFAEDVTQILIEMKTPGSKFLYLTEG